METFIRRSNLPDPNLPLIKHGHKKPVKKTLPENWRTSSNSDTIFFITIEGPLIANQEEPSTEQQHKGPSKKKRMLRIKKFHQQIYEYRNISRLRDKKMINNLYTVTKILFCFVVFLNRKVFLQFCNNVDSFVLFYAYREAVLFSYLYKNICFVIFSENNIMFIFLLKEL